MWVLQMITHLPSHVVDVERRSSGHGVSVNSRAYGLRFQTSRVTNVFKHHTHNVKALGDKLDRKCEIQY